MSKSKAIQYVLDKYISSHTQDEISPSTIINITLGDIKEAINIASEPGWIEVSEDNLPEIGWYIGHIAGGNVDMVYFKGKYFVFEPYGNAADVTHYLPTITLPEPKKKA